jgi:DNA phosphorothioation-associated putative methyltransferase
VLTRLGRFQKFYSQGELREYLQAELGVDAIAAAPGVFYLFKDEVLQQQFLASRYRRRAAAPRKRVSELRFEEHRELLERLMAAITDLGRCRKRMSSIVLRRSLKNSVRSSGSSP